MALDPRRESHGYAQTAKGVLNATKVPTGSLHSLEDLGLVLQALHLSCLVSPCSRHSMRMTRIFHPALWLVTCKKPTKNEEV